MFENGMWDAVYATLVTHGVLGDFESTLDIGLSVFRGNGASASETSPECATMTDVAVGPPNESAVESALTSIQSDYAHGMPRWETPTGFAVNYAAAALAALDVHAGTKKYILLVTDGPPDTCEVAAPQCGQDNAIAAVEAARALGIHTVVLGLAPFVDSNSGCPSSARCGVDYLQDLANAGAGRPVEPPPDDYQYQPCVIGRALLASYADAGGGAEATYYESGDGSTFGSDLADALARVVDDRVP